MKRRFSKILGVGLTLALLTSLLLTAAPVSALTQPNVSLGDYEISAITKYTIMFQVGEAVPATGSIVVEFLSGTTVPDTWAPTDVHIISTAGFGTAQDEDVGAYTTTDGLAVTIDLTTLTAGSDPWGIGDFAMVKVELAGIGNPDTTGARTLDVSTSEEDAVTSVAYTIIEPEIDVLPGVVELYNASGILMDNWTGKDAIQYAITDARADYVIEVGEGTYACDLGILAGKDNLELAGAEGAIIKGVATLPAASWPTVDPNIEILSDGVKIHGFTIESPDVATTYYSSGIVLDGTDIEIYNNSFISTGEGTAECVVIQTYRDGTTDISGLNIHDNEFSGTLTNGWVGVFINHTLTGDGTVTVQDNTFSGTPYQGVVTERDNTVISGNSLITDMELTGDAIIVMDWGPTGNYTNPRSQDNVQITSNTIGGSATDLGFSRGIVIGKETYGQVLTDISITENTIEGNDVGIKVRASANGVVVNSNNIIYDIDNETLGVSNTDSVTANILDATFNWWGTTVASEVADMVSTRVTYEPFLADTVEAVFSASDVATGKTSLDAKDTAGVAVSVTTTTVTIDTIAVAKYIANPEEAIAGAIAFYDVYVAGTGIWGDDDKATIKFYAGDAQTEVYIWSADTLSWGAVTPVNYSAYGGYVYVTIKDPAMLAGTPFALVAGAVTEPGIPEILVPVIGDDTVSLTPIFAWDAVTGADGYYFQLAGNANFVLPKVSLTGDLGRLIVTAYAHVEELPYSTPYYWRVKAVSGTVEAGNLAESAWASGVFITMDEPVEEAPPIVVEEAPPVVIETIQPPDIIVEIPAETAITPGWIYVIIAVGAVLVIAMVVLIVRTRRVA